MHVDVHIMEFYSLNHLGLIWILFNCVPSKAETNRSISKLEDGYIKHFGNGHRKWKTATIWSHEKNATKLKQFCSSAHVHAGRDPINVEVVILRSRCLKFFNPKYHGMSIVVAAYGIVGKETKGILERDYWYTEKPNHWYLTEGQRPDCVYFLNLADTKTGQFTLEQNVCGIELPV